MKSANPIPEAAVLMLGISRAQISAMHKKGDEQ